jgi:hypothetical protein
VLRVAVPDSRMLALACTPMMITHPLTKGDLNRGRAPDLKSHHWRCRIVDPATGALCTRRPHHDNEHRGYHTVQGTDRSSCLTTWTGGTERAMIIDSYCWNRMPGTDVDLRALAATPLALRYRPSGHRSRR